MTCSSGNDNKCVTEYGSNNCCMKLTVIDRLEKTVKMTTEEYNKELADFKNLGYPTGQGESVHRCQDRHALKVLINGDDNNQFKYQ